MRVLRALWRYHWIRWWPRRPNLGPWFFTCRMANARSWHFGALVITIPLPWSRVFLEGTALSAPWMLPKRSGIRTALGL